MTPRRGEFSRFNSMIGNTPFLHQPELDWLKLKLTMARWVLQKPMQTLIGPPHSASLLGAIQGCTNLTVNEQFSSFSRRRVDTGRRILINRPNMIPVFPVGLGLPIRTHG